MGSDDYSKLVSLDVQLEREYRAAALQLSQPFTQTTRSCSEKQGGCMMGGLGHDQQSNNDTAGGICGDLSAMFSLMNSNMEGRANLNRLKTPGATTLGDARLREFKRVEK